VEKDTDSPDLSSQERRVLKLVTEGLSDEEIAVQLGVTSNHVATHLSGIIQKTRTRSRTEAAVKAMKQGMFGRV
jgi:DNA-binding NarL/FixJ family response regulator